MSDRFVATSEAESGFCPCCREEIRTLFWAHFYRCASDQMVRERREGSPVPLDVDLDTIDEPPKLDPRAVRRNG